MVIRYLPAIGIALCLVAVLEISLPTRHQLFRVTGKEVKQLASTRGVKKFFKLEIAGNGGADYYVSEEAFNIVHTGNMIAVDMNLFTREWIRLAVVGTGESAELGRSSEPLRMAYALLGIAFGAGLFILRGNELLHWLSAVWPLPLFWEFFRSCFY